MVARQVRTALEQLDHQFMHIYHSHNEGEAKEEEDRRGRGKEESRKETKMKEGAREEGA